MRPKPAPASGGLCCGRLFRSRPVRRLLAILMAGPVFAAGFSLTGCRGPERLPLRAQPGDLVSYVPVAGRVVALTFDDGPNDPCTSQVLDLLDRESVRATFFLVGTNVERNPDAVRRMVQAGHAIGNHSYDHPRFDQISSAERRDEIRRGADAIAAVTGVRPVMFREPFGIFGPAAEAGTNAAGATAADRRFRGLSGLCRAENQLLAGISVHAYDWHKEPPEVMAEYMLRRVSAGAILLLHDGHETQVGADRSVVVKVLEQVLAALKARGYSFLTVPELIARAEPPLAAFDRGVALLGIGAPDGAATPGQPLLLRCYWSVPSEADAARLVGFMHLRQRGRLLVQADHGLPDGADMWNQAVEVAPVIPADAAPGACELSVGATWREGAGTPRRLAVSSDLSVHRRAILLPYAVRIAAPSLPDNPGAAAASSALRPQMPPPGAAGAARP